MRGKEAGSCVGELPAARHVETVDQRREGQEQLELCKQGEVIGGNVGVRAASDIVLVEPVGVQWAEHTQHVQQRLRVEDVIDHTLRRTEEHSQRWGEKL